ETALKIEYDKEKRNVMKYISYTLFFLYLHLAAGQVTVVEDSLFSSSLNATTKFYAILPDGYTKSQERYPAIYLLHGFGGNYTNWVKLTEIVKYAKQHNFIIITPDAKNSWYANSPVVPNANYEDFIIKDVIPFVDNKYRTIQSKFYRAIAGLSMGGYGAAKFGIKYPGLFFFAGCLSPAIQFPAGMDDSTIVIRRSKESNESVKQMFGYPRNERWNENDVNVLLEKANSKSLPYFYLSVGSQDGITEIIDLTHSFATALRKKGVSFEMHETPGGHDWRFWDKEIEIILQRITELSRKKR
ncbi:MAG: alpha/beta hydrolase family protein, partial [Bacteroidota bacterium]